MQRIIWDNKAEYAALFAAWQNYPSRWEDLEHHAHACFDSVCWKVGHMESGTCLFLLVFRKCRYHLCGGVPSDWQTEIHIFRLGLSVSQGCFALTKHVKGLMYQSSTLLALRSPPHFNEALSIVLENLWNKFGWFDFRQLLGLRGLCLTKLTGYGNPGQHSEKQPQPVHCWIMTTDLYARLQALRMARLRCPEDT